MIDWYKLLDIKTKTLSNLLWVAFFVCNTGIAQTDSWVEATHIETMGCCAKFEIVWIAQDFNEAPRVSGEAIFYSPVDENICCEFIGIRRDESGFTNELVEAYQNDFGLKQLVDDEIKIQTTFLRENGDASIFAMPAIKLFPKPSNDFLYIQVMSDAEIFANYRIRDFGGQIVATGERQLLVNNQLRIEVEMLNEGKHYIELWLNGKSTFKPFVVSRNAF